MFRVGIGVLLLRIGRLLLVSSFGVNLLVFQGVFDDDLAVDVSRVFEVYDDGAAVFFGFG